MLKIGDKIAFVPEFLAKNSHYTRLDPCPDSTTFGGFIDRLVEESALVRWKAFASTAETFFWIKSEYLTVLVPNAKNDPPPELEGGVSRRGGRHIPVPEFRQIHLEIPVDAAATPAPVPRTPPISTSIFDRMVETAMDEVRAQVDREVIGNIQTSPAPAPVAETTIPQTSPAVAVDTETVFQAIRSRPDYDSLREMVMAAAERIRSVDFGWSFTNLQNESNNRPLSSEREGVVFRPAETSISNNTIVVDSLNPITSSEWTNTPASNARMSADRSGPRMPRRSGGIPADRSLTTISDRGNRGGRRR